MLNRVGAFQATLLSQGRLRPGSVDAYGKALACAAKQAQRFLGRPLTGLAEIYQVDVIAAVAKDDVPFDETKDRLRKSTLRLRRTVLGAYLRAVGVPGMSFTEARAVLDEGFRRAARRRGYSYTIASGRRPGHHYRPPREDVDKVIALARSASTTFVGARNAAVLMLALRTGLRCHSILAMDGADFSERHGQLFLLVTEKGRPGRREIEVPSEVIPELTRYEGAYKRCALERGWPAPVGIGVPGPFWRGCRGRPWSYGGLLAMVRVYTRMAGVTPFTMHGLRHLRASTLGRHLPAEEAAAAGGWHNVRVLNATMRDPRGCGSRSSPDRSRPRSRSRLDRSRPMRGRPVERFTQTDLLREGEARDALSAETSTELAREALREVYVFAVGRLSDPTDQEPAWRVEDEVSRLKHIVRKSLEAGGPGTLLELSQSPEVAACLFTEPGRLHRWDVSKLWQTYRDFVEAMVRPEEETDKRLRAIEDRLLPRQTRGWHQVERVGGGHRYGAGRDSRLLFAVDLVAICSKAAAGRRGEAALRDEALVRLCCWSGLRFSEIAFLRWQQLEWEQEPDGKLFPVWVRCRRRKLELRLPVHFNALPILRRLYALAQQSTDRTPQGSVFRTLRQPYRRLSLREAREILERALERADFAGASILDLRAAFADHLNTKYGVTRLELTEILGYGEHKHVRHLLEGHHSWYLNQKADAADAQRGHSSEEIHDEEGRARRGRPLV